MQKLDIIQRIQLRDEIFEEFKSLKLIILLNNFNNNQYRIWNKNKIDLFINDELKIKYELFLNQYRTEEEALYCLTHFDDFENHICPVCSNICKFYNKKHGYRDTCGNKDCHQKAIESTNSIIYGTKYGLQNEKVKEKGRQTNKTIRGVDHHMKTKESVQKGKNTREKLYGNPNYNNREGARQTCMNKYGKENYVETNQFKIQSYQTCLKNWNASNPMRNQINVNKQQEKMLSEYGARHALQIKEFKDKLISTYVQNHGPKNPITDKNILIIIDNIKSIFCNNNIDISNIYYNDDYFIVFIKLLYQYKNEELIKINEICDIFKRSRTTIRDKIEKLKLLEYFDIKDSELELQFKELLESAELIENIDFERANRNILSKNRNTEGQPELDFYLKDYNIAFEINDTASHNCIKQLNQFYHYNKTNECLKKNIRLIHLWEWELTDENLWRCTSNWILNLLNNSKIQIDIKDCVIKEININETRDFLNEYNLYSYLQSDIALGLYHNNELLQVMTFKHQINNEFELLRFSTKFRYEIEFGAKELLDHFIKKYNPSQITTTVNLDKFTGTTFKELGFKLLEYKEPILIGNNESKYKLMYNCGQIKYVFNYEYI